MHPPKSINGMRCTVQYVDTRVKLSVDIRTLSDKSGDTNDLPLESLVYKYGIWNYFSNIQGRYKSLMDSRYKKDNQINMDLDGFLQYLLSLQLKIPWSF